MMAFGTNDITKAYVGSIEVSKAYLGNELVWSGDSQVLPYDAEVGYLESDGSAYIDTGIIPTLSYSFECRFYYVSPYSSNDASATLFGCLSGWQSQTFFCAIGSKGYGYNSWGNKAVSLQNATFWNSLLNSWHKLEFKSKTTYFDDVSKFSASSGTGNPVVNMYIFCANQAGQYQYGVGTVKRISYAKIFDNNNALVRDYIPVRVGTVGYMYDKVSGELFGNSGTGSFVLGNDV